MTINAAILDGNNVVINIIVLSSLDEWPGAIDATGAVIGATWDGAQFIAPAPPVPAPVPPIVTRLAFRNRFAQGEKVALELAALDDPTAPMPQRQQAAALRAYLADVAAASFIDLSRPDTRAGVQFLEAAGMLADGRALEILDAPVQPEERPL